MSPKMPEVTSFPILPNIQAAELTGAVERVARFIRTSSPDERSLRKTLRQWKLWDKERTPAFLDLLKVHNSDDAMEPGPFLSHYLNIVDETERRTLIFQYLRDLNPILVKSIFDALDTERGGRIQSTNELYRLVTSYVYPGEHISLPDFQHWVTWMHGVDVLRTIGLRWGFGTIGTVFREEIREMEMDEILEDLEDGLASSWEDAAATATPASAEKDQANDAEGEDPEPVETAPASEKTTKTQSPKTTAPKAQKKDKKVKQSPKTKNGEDAIGPAPEPIVSAPPPKRGKARVVVAATAPPAPTLPVTLSPVFVRGGAQIMVPLTDKDAAANAEDIQGWWQTYPFRGPYRAKDFGLTIEGLDEGPETLSELCVAALFVGRREGNVAASTALAALRETGALNAWITGTASFEESVGTVGLLSLVGGDARFLDLLPIAVQVCTALRAEPRRIADWTEETPETTIRALHVDVFGRTSPMAPFWVIREALMANLIDDPMYERVAVVPTRTAREHGYRLGFMDSLYAEGMEDLLKASAKLQRFCGKDCEYNAPLEFLQDHLGCRFRCPVAAECSYRCREKTAL